MREFVFHKNGEFLKAVKCMDGSYAVVIVSASDPVDFVPRITPQTERYSSVSNLFRALGDYECVSVRG